MENVVYPFGSEFQLKIMALLIRDKRFLQVHRRIIKPQYFDNPIFLNLCKQIVTYFDMYKVTPTQVAICDMVGDQVNADDLEMLIDRLYEVDLEDAEYIKTQTLQFARNQAVIRAQYKVEELRKVGDFDGIKTVMDQALLIGTEQEELGQDFFGDVDDLCVFLSADGNKELRLQTMLVDLDKTLGGGSSKGELNIVMAPPNEGKSIWLINMAFSALWQRKNVLFVSIEMNNMKIAKRLACRFTGIPMGSMAEKAGQLPKLLAEYSQSSGQLKIKYSPSASVDDIRALLINLQQTEGFVADVLIVDYLDIIRPPNKNTDAYVSQGDIAKALRSLAGEFQLHLWTATQANRNSIGKDHLGMNDKADSWRVMADADVVLGLTRSDMDATQNTATISFAKIRDGDKSSRLMTVRADYEQMYFGDI